MVKELLKIKATASSTEEAVDVALEKLGCTRAETEVQILQTPSRGFFNIWRVRPAIVVIRLVDRGYIARKITERLLELVGVTSSVYISQSSQQVELSISSEQSSLLIGKHGLTLDGLQSMVISLTDRVTPQRLPIFIDIDGYRSRRVESLKRLTRRLAFQARRRGQVSTTQTLSPEDRKIIHQALDMEQDVQARSVGKGVDRKMIFYTRTR